MRIPKYSVDELLRCSIIVLDKPSNYDSHQTAALIKKLLGVKKVGHAGTLDPKVTGVLLVLIDKATRLAGYLLHSKKEYVGIMHLHKNVSIKELRSIIEKKFLGKIKQLPPRKAAIKRQEREREIYSFKIIEKKGNNVLFKVNCEAGTYIRKLIHDLGVALGVKAHMLELRRTKDGIFREDNCATLYDIINALKNKNLEKVLLPPEVIVKNMQKIVVKDSALDKLYNGSPVFYDFLVKRKKLKEGYAAVLSSNGKLVEIAKVIYEKNIIAKPKTILML